MSTGLLSGKFEKLRIEREIDMSWSYNRDENLLSDRAVNEAIATFLKFNTYMAFASEDCGSKKDMACAAAFLEMCKQKINVELDKKIEVMKERAK